ncbi:helix-turn-helix domain-containing protein [Streptococcus acidominimus]|uniref:Helix-turn-helix domain-containing protein n=1 Tax=Streptococcus acidominimus TaxID=1326 RepID=A0A4Y9FJW5_STRAI|nr:helix-turn-helix domain-containing protein [Streptococcus acidominimus]MBF0819762.1 helix-turn-helix domain-containing protein [Streptococcus acidominimus]MBF0839846.1 helix-turn-helix domain-containing protein [Streptococcus acidominimus]MBF0846466.1 helix-turn-helix domain-containing protein [Streptococcus danieliae]TFU29477.1 helix-turn-helix domain-containing protein [Streptococcus acidominimus]
MKRSPKSVEEKCEILQLYLSHKQSLSQLTKTYPVSDYAIRHWMKRYESDGVDGPIEKAWAKLKKKVMELLPKYNAVIDCLNSAFLSEMTISANSCFLPPALPAPKKNALTKKY